MFTCKCGKIGEKTVLKYIQHIKSTERIGLVWEFLVGKDVRNEDP